MTISPSQANSATFSLASQGGAACFWAWAGVRLTAGGFMAGRPAS
ncbi:MAG TPA: hypothetical protein VGE07_12655 [Herpetosiphonaceae bacterium]